MSWQRTMTWTDVDGLATPLDGSAGVILMADPVGLDVAPPTNTIDDYLGFDGGALINRRQGPRSIALGIYVEHATRVETMVETIADMFQGPGTLQWTDETGSKTLRQVIYEAGIDGSGTRNFRQGAMVVSLVALDPWWYGDAVSVPLSFAGTTAFSAAIAFDAAIPFDGGNSATVVVTGSKHSTAFPVITVTGPGTVTVSLGSLGWTNTTALGASDVLVVDSRPGSRGPRLNGGSTDWSLITPGSRLFTLAQGSNSIVVGASGTTGATTVVMQYEPRSRTP